MSIISSLSNYEDGTFQASFLEAFISAADRMSRVQPDEAVLPYYLPMEQLSLERRLTVTQHEDAAKLSLMDSSSETLSASLAARFGELNEYQFLFLQYFADSNSIPQAALEEMPLLQLLRDMTEPDTNPDWLVPNYRGLLLSIYPSTREAVVRDGLAYSLFAGTAMEQGLELEELRREGSRRQNYEKSERARAIASHISKVMHKIVILNAGTRGSAIPESLDPFVRAATDMQDLSIDVITREFNLHTGYFRGIVDIMASYLVDWFITGNIEQVYEFIPFNSGDIDRQEQALQLYQTDVAAPAQEFLDYTDEVTGINLGMISEFFGFDEVVAQLRRPEYSDDPDAAVEKLRVVRAQLESWLHDNRGGNLLTTSLYMISLAKLLQTDILRTVPGKVLPPLAVPTTKGGYVFPDGIVVAPENHSPPGMLWKELADSKEPIMLVEIKAYSRLKPPTRVLKDNVIQTMYYVESLAALGVNVRKVLFAYIAPTTLKIIPVTAEGLRAMHTSYQL